MKSQRTFIRSCGKGQGTNTLENLVLIGYMGSGKTTVGKTLAKMMQFSFLDTDEMIEKQQNKTIREIFAADGEQAFRDLETDLLKQLVAEKRKHLVLSTGGGMPLRAENQKLLSKLGLVVYLKAEPETIYHRVKNDTKRPLLQCENPFAAIKEMIDVRNPVYEEAAAQIVQVNACHQVEIAEQIKRQYLQYSNSSARQLNV